MWDETCWSEGLETRSEARGVRPHLEKPNPEGHQGRHNARQEEERQLGALRWPLGAPWYTGGNPWSQLDVMSVAVLCACARPLCGQRWLWFGVCLEAACGSEEGEEGRVREEEGDESCDRWSPKS